jgi:hypothetical protein
MMSCIRPVQVERRELADKMVRCLPDLNMRFVCDSNERSIRRKLDSIDWLFEIEMMKDNAPTEVDEESPPILVDSDQNGPIGAKGESSDIFAILERKGKGLVIDQIKHGDPVAHGTEHGIAVGSEYDVSLLIDSTA